MIKSNDEIFQERVDELLLMEKRIERKTTQLTEYNDNLQAKIANTINRIDNASNSFEQTANHKLDRLEKLSDTTNGAAVKLAKYSENSMLIFTIFMVIAGLFAIGATWRLNYLLRQINIAKDMLAQLDLKLSRTPAVIKWGGDDYIRIAPNSDLNFSKYKPHHGPQEGTYARVWCSKR